MTISTTTSRIQYAGNGVTTIFSFPYRFLVNGDLEVTLFAADGSSTLKALTTDYTVTGADEDAGGSVTMLVAPAVGQTLVIRRVVDLTQETDYSSGDAFPAETHERALDKLTMMDQQLQEQVDRSIVVPLDDDTFSGQLPAIVASRFLRVNDAGTAFELVDALNAGELVVSPFIETLLDDADAAAARGTLVVPSRTGDDASGTWGINISGNATTATSVVGTAVVTSLNGGQLAGLRNLVINGNFAFNQRAYVSGAATSGANQYTLDRWRVVTSGQNATFSASGNGRVVTAPAGGLEQVIDGANIAGGTYVINWTGTATCTVDGVTKAKGATFTLTAATNATIRFSSGTVELVQVELGSTATPFEQRATGLESALCGWYFRLWEVGYSDATATSSTRYAFSQYPEMRSAPTVVNLAAIGTQSNVSTVAFSDVSARGLRMDITPSGSATVLCRRSISLASEF